ncbi:MAG: non-ribosomal peptide synthetase, partial [Bacteroidetes bacterium]|nr:non-ribosomal peptide synthetase [Bacteroidota bacterium]
GHTWMGQEIIIVNPETGAKLGENQIGEIWVSGDHVAQGYWQKPELNKAVFQAYTSNTQEGPFLRTGDLGFIHENEVYITGREKDLIIIRGRNHYPQDIEKTAAESFQGLRPGGSAAFSLDVDGSEKLVVVQEIDRGVLKNASEEEIFAAIRKEISLRHELQVYGIALIKQRSIPKTSSGKIQRKATKKAYLNDTLKIEAAWVAEGEVTQVEEVVTESQLTRADIQQWIINWVAKELDIPAVKIDPEESIQAYGIDSMATARFEEEVSKFVGFTWPVMDLLINEPSIAEISEKGEELIIEASGRE